jgi:hypothetical protein
MNILQSAALLNPILSLASRSLFKIISMNFSLCSPVRRPSGEKVVCARSALPLSHTQARSLAHLNLSNIADARRCFSTRTYIRLFNMRNKMRGTYHAGNCYKTAPKVYPHRKNYLCFACCGAIKLLCLNKLVPRLCLFVQFILV